MGFKKDYLRRLWMNILTVASFPPTHPPTDFLGTPETSCNLTCRGLSIETMSCCAGSEGNFRTQKRDGIPIAPQKIESVAWGKTPSKNHHHLRAGRAVGAVSVLKKKTQECLTSWDCSHDATGSTPVHKHYYSRSDDLCQI